MSSNKKHRHAIVAGNLDWQKSVRCTIILKSLLVAAMVFAAPVTFASEHSPMPPPSKPTFLKSTSSGKALLCVPPQNSRMEKRSDTTAQNRIQRNAGDPTLSYAMALSMALGLRSVAGPVMKSEKPAARTANISGPKVGANVPVAKRLTLSASNKTYCPDLVSMKGPGDRLAME